MFPALGSAPEHEPALGPCPDDHSRTVTDAFAEERPRLVSLPANPFPCEERREGKVGKTPYVRFDGNDYSVPHTLVRCTLTVAVTQERVRVLCQGEGVAEHRRSFDRGQQIEDPAHIEALRQAKGEAREHRAIDRLAHAAPSSQELFVRLAEHGDNLGNATQLMLRLLDECGAQQAGGGHPGWRWRAMCCTTMACARSSSAEGLPPPTPVESPGRTACAPWRALPRVRDLAVPPQRVDRYDELYGGDAEPTDPESRRDLSDEGDGDATAFPRRESRSLTSP